MAKQQDIEQTNFTPVLWSRIHINVEGEKEYIPTCTIGVQTFAFGRPCETFNESLWYCTCMVTALQNAKQAADPIVYKRPVKGFKNSKKSNAPKKF